MAKKVESKKSEEEIELEKYQKEKAKKLKSFRMKRTKIYKRYYNLFVSSVKERDNFNEGHLTQLDILCNLYVEYEILTEKIEEEFVVNGLSYWYESMGRHGVQRKVIPEIAERNKVMAEIRHFTKMLGLVLVKDKSDNKDGKLKEDWQVSKKGN